MEQLNNENSNKINDYIVFNELEINLLEQLEITFEKDNLITDDLLESFYFIYKNPLLEALNQIDKHDLNNSSSGSANLLATCIKCESSDRCIYQVKGSIGINYYLFKCLNFCSCSSFKYNVLNKNEYIYCKHIIIVKLLKAMNKISLKHVKDTEFVELIKQIH